MQLGKFFAFHAKTLIFRKVPVENIHFHGFHAVDIPLQNFHGHEMAARIDHQATPGKARLIVNRYRWSGKSLRRHGHQLQKSLQAVHGAQRRFSI